MEWPGLDDSTQLPYVVFSNTSHLTCQHKHLACSIFQPPHFAGWCIWFSFVWGYFEIFRLLIDAFKNSAESLPVLAYIMALITLWGVTRLSNLRSLLLGFVNCWWASCLPSSHLLACWIFIDQVDVEWIILTKRATSLRSHTIERNNTSLQTGLWHVMTRISINIKFSPIHDWTLAFRRISCRLCIYGSHPKGPCLGCRLRWRFVCKNDLWRKLKLEFTKVIVYRSMFCQSLCIRMYHIESGPYV